MLLIFVVLMIDLMAYFSSNPVFFILLLIRRMDERLIDDSESRKKGELNGINYKDNSINPAWD